MQNIKVIIRDKNIYIYLKEAICFIVPYEKDGYIHFFKFNKLVFYIKKTILFFYFDSIGYLLTQNGGVRITKKTQIISVESNKVCYFIVENYFSDVWYSFRYSTKCRKLQFLYSVS